jgi:hypothetical protein
MPARERQRPRVGSLSSLQLEHSEGCLGPRRLAPIPPDSTVTAHPLNGKTTSAEAIPGARSHVCQY